MKVERVTTVLIYDKWGDEIENPYEILNLQQIPRVGETIRITSQWEPTIDGDYVVTGVKYKIVDFNYTQCEITIGDPGD